jgi:hypothetical protein
MQHPLAPTLRFEVMSDWMVHAPSASAALTLNDKRIKSKPFWQSNLLPEFFNIASKEHAV